MKWFWIIACTFFTGIALGWLYQPNTIPTPTHTNDHGVNTIKNTYGTDTASVITSVVPYHDASSDTPTQFEQAHVLLVIDGDTIEVRMVDGSTERVRYIGIDTPETVHPSKPVECFGNEASMKNRELVEGKEVVLMRDVSDRDRYGRLLRYVYVGEMFVNEVLVQDGYAHAYPYPPDVTHEDLLRKAEHTAREEKKGLWGDVCESFVSLPTTMPVHDCTIKGNIGTSGEKIYHLVGCKSYDKTVITEEKGEQWFCSEAEAEAAGWRKAQNC